MTDTFNSINARYVRLTVTGVYNDPTTWTSICELRVFAPAGVSPTPTSTPTPTPSPTPTPTPTPVTSLYSEDFEDSVANGWTVVSGTWSIATDGTKVYNTLPTDSLSRSVVGDSTWSSYSVETKAKVNSWGNTSYRTVGILGRYVDTNNYYVFAYEAPGNLNIKKKAAGTMTTLVTKSYALNTGNWYNIKAVMDGSTLKLYVNGVEELTTTDNSLSTGKAGLISVYGDNRFDDFVVK